MRSTKSSFPLSNSLLQAMIIGKENEMLKLIFDELKSYTEYHFTAEEQYMTQIGYPFTESTRPRTRY